MIDQTEPAEKKAQLGKMIGQTEPAKKTQLGKMIDRFQNERPALGKMMIRQNGRRKTKTAKLDKMMTLQNDRRLANSAELGKMMHHLVEYGL